MAWIAIVPPSPRHPHERYQVRYQDGKRQRSAGIFPTMRRAEAERRAIERTGREPLPHPTEPDQAKARTLLGEYVTAKWWPAWKDQHPASEYGTRKKVEKRILPAFGNITSSWPAVAASGRRARPSTPVPPLTNSRIRDGRRGWWARGVDRALVVMAASGRPPVPAPGGSPPGTQPPLIRLVS